jgi:Na+-transporting NADH:ubiquinone oxidoreductase subunit B
MTTKGMTTKGKTTKGNKVIKFQPNMLTVLIALVPVILSSLYFYGLSALLLLLVTNTVAYFTEWWFTHRRGEPVTLAVFVSATLLALSLPPATPYWIAGVGSVVAITFGKELFGGMGRNIFNPALVGRAFIFVSFPNSMTANWVEPLKTPGLVADAISSATPLKVMAAGGDIPLIDLLLGARSGSLGEGCVVLLLLGGLYMYKKKVASWQITLSVILSYSLFATLFYFMGWGVALNPLKGILAGGIIFGAIFMATDPISAPHTPKGRIAFGIIIGLCATLIRYLGNFPEGVMFAILMGNIFGPAVEEGLKEFDKFKLKRGEPS